MVAFSLSLASLSETPSRAGQHTFVDLLHLLLSEGAPATWAPLIHLQSGQRGQFLEGSVKVILLPQTNSILLDLLWALQQSVGVCLPAQTMPFLRFLALGWGLLRRTGPKSCSSASLD